LENNSNNQLPEDYTKNKRAGGDENNEIVSLDEILSLLIRRRLPILVSFILLLILSYGILIYRRIFTPIYLGSFLMLVDDPLNNSANMSRSNNEQVDLVQTLATNSFSSTNIPTLKEFLKSDKLLRKNLNNFLKKGVGADHRLNDPSKPENWAATDLSKNQKAKFIDTVDYENYIKELNEI